MPTSLHNSARALAALGLGDAAQLQRQRDIVLDRQPWKQVGLLEHHAHLGEGCVVAPARSPEVATAHLDHPAAGRLIEAGDDAQHRRLAAARRPEEDGEFTFCDIEIGRREGPNRALRGFEVLAGVLQSDGETNALVGAYRTSLHAHDFAASSTNLLV
jgi:hypothetical protein